MNPLLRSSITSARVIAALSFVVVLTATQGARAGTYPMYQCRSSTPAVAPGWSVGASNTTASAVLSNDCAVGGAIGNYVFTAGQPGAVTESGSDGSQVTLAVSVPASAPNVTIQSLSVHVIASAVTGDDAFLGFSSTGQALPGLIELPYGSANPYTTNETWTLPQGARDFEAFVNCSTDRSSPTCTFAQNTEVPALNDITLTLRDTVAPAVTSVSGTLASAAAAQASVSGEQTLGFAATDADSGVRAAVLTLTPSAGGSTYTRKIDYATQCAYDSWNACPRTQTASAFTVDASTLASGSYAAALAVTDAAGNVANDELGTINRPVAGAALGSTGGTGAAGTVGSINGPGAATPLLGGAATWRVSLSVSPRHVRRHTLITLSGRVATQPRPQGGKLIYLQARSVRYAWRGRGRMRHRVVLGGRWITFQELRAKPGGTFTATYRFRLGGVHRYQMRAVAPREGGYRNPTGVSAAIAVTES